MTSRVCKLMIMGNEMYAEECLYRYRPVSIVPIALSYNHYFINQFRMRLDGVSNDALYNII